MADSGKNHAHHIAIFPSSGMGHLTPALRLAASLANQNIQVTFITIQPNVSLSESQFVSKFLSAFPQVISKEFHLLPFDPSTANSKDPFFLQMESIRRSVPLLSPLLSSSSPPLSALITDIFMASCVIPITSKLHLPNYILYTSSAMMSCFTAYSPALLETSTTQITDDVRIPGLFTIPMSWIPPLLLDLTNLFATLVISNGRALKESDGILINTFDSLEPELLKDLKKGKVASVLPPVIPIGPLPSCQFERGSELQWLSDKPAGSVVYVSFGSRTAMSREQIRELGVGLVKSGCQFVWVVKFNKVDKNEEGQDGEEQVLGTGLVKELKEKGLLINSWVDQTQILSHPSVGGFVSHCGWNSVTEAAMHGVPVLAWPHHGDQKMNAAIVKKTGLGMWEESWGWAEEKLVKGEEIAERIRDLMKDEGLRLQAAKMKEEAGKSFGAAGLSTRLSTANSGGDELNATNSVSTTPINRKPSASNDRDTSTSNPIKRKLPEDSTVPNSSTTDDAEGFWRTLFNTESTASALNSTRNNPINAVATPTVNNDSNPSTSSTKKQRLNEDDISPDGGNTNERVLRRQHRARVRQQIRQANAAYEESWEKHLPKPYKPKLDNHGWRKWPWVRMPWTIAGYKENAHIVCDIWTYEEMITRLPEEHPIHRIRQLDYVEM